MKYLFLCCCLLGAPGCSGSAPRALPSDSAADAPRRSATEDEPFDSKPALAAAAASSPATAIEDLAREARAHPDALELLDALVATAGEHGLAKRAVELLRANDAPAWTWYRGRAHYLLAEALRPAGTSGDFAPALAELDRALDCFATALRGRPDYADTCAQWRVLCLGKKGNLAFLTGDIDHAEAWLLQAVGERPDQLETSLGSNETIKLGLLRVGDRVMRDFARAERIYRTAADAVGTDVDLLNNAAVFARDLGTRLERAGKPDAARAMFERSYASYLRCVQQAPGDVRLRNDTALVAIHHLHQDRDRARQLLEAAIADGEASLHDGQPADDRARENLGEAVGDCYENLALWHLQAGDAKAARACAERSLRYPPFERRTGARRHLEAAAQMPGGS